MRHSSSAPPRSARRQPQGISSPRRSRTLDLLLTIAVALALVAGADAVVLSRISGSDPANVLDATAMENTAVERTATAVCTLVVPSGPLTAQGLATPYRLKGASD